MGCSSSSQSAVEPIEVNELDDVGPRKKRHCTDIFFLILFILFIGGMVYVGSLCFMKGNVNLLLYGYDSWGNICGQDNTQLNISTQFAGRNMDTRTKAFFFNQNFFLAALPNMGIAPDPDPIIVCVAKCPSETLLFASDVNTFATETGTGLCRYDVDSYISNSTLCPVLPLYPHKSILNRCIPSSLFQTAAAIASSVSGMVSGDVAQCVVSDIMVTWREILYMVAIAFVTALLIVVMLRIFAAIIVWTIVFLSTLLVIGAAGYCWYKWYLADKAYKETIASKQTPAQQDLIRTWLIYSCIASGIALITVLVLLVMRKRLKLVVQLFKEAGRAIGKMPLLLLQPVWTLLILITSLGSLLVVALYMETSSKLCGHIKKFPFDFSIICILDFMTTRYWLVRTFQTQFWPLPLYTPLILYLRWFHIFGVFWVSAFIVACQDLVIAGAVSIWYFSRDKSNLGCPICRSTYNIMRYHLGSVAFGSFLIAVVRFVRFVLMVIHAKLKGKTNKFAEFLLKMLHCCLKCFEKFLQYINRNAYIQIAIHGNSFCEGARKAMITIINNVLRVAAINSVGDFLLFLSKLGCVAIVVVAGNELLAVHEDINYKWVPLTVGGALAFVIAHCFMLVYEICLDTIFMCFCEDCEMNNGSDKPYFMSTNLMTCVSNIEMKTVTTVSQQPAQQNSPKSKAVKGGKRVMV